MNKQEKQFKKEYLEEKNLYFIEKGLDPTEIVEFSFFQLIGYMKIMEILLLQEKI